MDITTIFGIQFLLSLLVFSLIAIRVSPFLNRLNDFDALFWLTMPHAFRHIGLVFLVPGVVAPTMPGSFSLEAAYGDLASALLAISMLVAILYRKAITIPLAWLLTVVGTFDLANALRQIDAVPHFNAAWYIPTFVVPLLLVTHGMMLVRLIRTFGQRKFLERIT